MQHPGYQLRVGFTLVEMLVVIGIIATIAAIGIGSTIGLGNRATAEGVEQVVSGLVRQARTTALATGAPVELRVEADSARITGVTQLPLYTESFDGLPGGLSGSMPGIGGNGWMVGLPDSASTPGSLVGDGSNGLIDAIDLASPRIPDNDGVYLSIWVRPLTPTSSPGNWNPLIYLGDSDDPTTALLGLALELESRVVQEEDGPTAELQHWVPVGFVDGLSGTLLSGAIEDGTLHPSSSDADVADIIVGDRWIELGLLYDGTEAVLYRDGEEVARATATVDLDPLPQLWIAREAGTPGTGVVDNVRVYHLAAANPPPLPNNVVPAGDYRIVVDGSTVRVDGTSGGTLRFAVGNPAITVDVAVTADGIVTSTQTN